MTKLHLALMLVVTPAVAAAQENTRAPIIDMHLHGGYKVGAFVTEPDGAPLRRPSKSSRITCYLSLTNSISEVSVRSGAATRNLPTTRHPRWSQSAAAPQQI